MNDQHSPADLTQGATTIPGPAIGGAAGERLVLISHPLCPYVQRVAIALGEKGVACRRIDVDLSAKPDWFLALSPLGKTPVLVVDGVPVFESAVILEYLEDTTGTPLHPADPLARARHRGWIEYASTLLNDIAGLYSAADAAGYRAAADRLRGRFAGLAAGLRAARGDAGGGPFFAGSSMSLVDAAVAPVFRYLDVLDGVPGLDLLAGQPDLADWRAALAARASVRTAAPADYTARLRAFLRARQAHLAGLVPPAADAATAG